MGRRIKFIGSFEADYAILEAVLKVNGITLEHRETDGSKMVASLTDRGLRDIRYGSTPVLLIKDLTDLARLPKDNELVTAIIELKHADPTQVERTLTQRLVDRQGVGSIVSVLNQPVIIMRDFSREIRYFAEIIRAIDVMPKSVEMKVYTLQNAFASDVAQYLQQLSGGSSSRGRVAPRGVPTTTGLEAQFVADQRTNKLIVLTFPENFQNIEKVITELDEEIPEGTGNIHIYMLKHTNATKMAVALQSILSGQQQQRQPSVRRGAQVPQQLQVVPSRVVAEDQNNALIIEAEKKDYEELLTVIKQLDIRRPQVLIEAAIIEVSADSTTNMGIELATVDVAGQGFRGAGGTYYGLSTIDPENLTKQPNAGLGLTALMYKDEFNRIPVLLNMMRTNSDVNVLSSPRLLTNDNEQGEIKVTDQVATTTYIDPQQGASRQQFGGYQDAGITLTITPHISTDNYLRLEIQLKIEQFTTSPVAGSATPPPKTTREIKGVITVPDREVIIIGGLTSEEETETVNKIPILGDIPILGFLFRNTSVNKRKTNLYVFITPHIMNDEKFDSIKKISREQMKAAKFAGGKVGSVSEIMKELPEVYGKWKTKAFLEMKDSLKDLFGRDFKKAFVIEPQDMDNFFKK
jgi:general secretion pathway protein D